MKSKWDNSKEIYTQTHHSKSTESQRQKILKAAEMTQVEGTEMKVTADISEIMEARRY